jgi:hypothetical protein
MTASPANDAPSAPHPDSDLASRLLQARRAARLVAFRNVATPLWTPKRGQCHRNVAEFVTGYPDYYTVRGWLIFDLQRGSGGLLSAVRFLAHSIARNGDTLIDITPSRGAGRYPFIVHPGPDAEFDTLVEAQGIVSIDCRVPNRRHDG